MTQQDAWRRISADELGVIASVMTTSGIRGSAGIIEDLSGALVSNSTPWIIEVKAPSAAAAATDFADGPFPARAYVPSKAAYQGEIIIWLTSGQVSGLEYAWITDEPPNRWPRPDEMEVVAQEGF